MFCSIIKQVHQHLIFKYSREFHCVNVCTFSQILFRNKVRSHQFIFIYLVFFCKFLINCTSEDIPLNEASANLDISFDYFYNEGLNAFASQLKDEKMSKITRIILIESYHNDKIRDFLKKSIIEEAVNGWIVLFDLMKSKKLVKEDVDSKQLAESFYKYGLFLLYEHYIINYPEDDAKFVDELCDKSQKHIKLLYDSVRR